MPESVSLNGIVKFFIKRINKKWEADKICFDQEDYETLSRAYWANFNHRTLPVELSADQTTALVERCRKEEVTVNSALTVAFTGAQSSVWENGKYQPSVGVAVNVRDRLRQPAGEGMGFYAGVANLDYKYDPRAGFWENTRKFHQKVKPKIASDGLFQDFVLWCHLEPAILEAINFKKLGGLVPAQAERYEKLSTYSQQDDVVLSILKRDKTESLDRIIMGTAVTNLGRLDFPTEYGAFELDRLIMQPGGAFPLVNVNLVLGAVTCAGKLSLILEYAEESVDTATMEAIRDKALQFLLSA
jgi:hypothetical protein